MKPGFFVVFRNREAAARAGAEQQSEHALRAFGNGRIAADWAGDGDGTIPSLRDKEERRRQTKGGNA